MCDRIRSLVRKAADILQLQFAEASLDRTLIGPGIAQSVADPEFQAQATKFFAPLRYLAPSEYEALVRDADVMYRAMWKEMPWSDK